MPDPNSSKSLSWVRVGAVLALLAVAGWVVFSLLGTKGSGPTPEEVGATAAVVPEGVDADVFVAAAAEAPSTQREPVPITAPDSDPAAVRDNGLITLSGRVLDGVTGEGLADVVVRARVRLFPTPGRTLHASTDADGRYVFDQALPGRFSLRFVHDDYCTVRLKPTMIKLGEQITLDDVLLHRGASVVGRVRVDAEPVSRATVHALPQADQRFRSESLSTRVGQDGRFQFGKRLPPGRYRLMVSLGVFPGTTGLGKRGGQPSMMRDIDVFAQDRELDLDLDFYRDR